MLLNLGSLSPFRTQRDRTAYNIVHVASENIINGLALIVSAVVSLILLTIGGIATILASFLGALCGRTALLEPKDVLKHDSIERIVQTIFEYSQPVKKYVHKGVDYLFCSPGAWRNN